jgi:tripartite-type tricarboxylate transporter receptor subunit TctC
LHFCAVPGFPVNSVDEFVEHAKRAAAAGKPLTYASVGIRSFYHLLGQHLSRIIGALDDSRSV